MQVLNPIIYLEVQKKNKNFTKLEIYLIFFSTLATITIYHYPVGESFFKQWPLLLSCYARATHEAII